MSGFRERALSGRDPGRPSWECDNVKTILYRTIVRPSPTFGLDTFHFTFIDWAKYLFNIEVVFLYNTDLKLLFGKQNKLTAPLLLFYSAIEW
jgi:hypothetical protein